ncbi:MAG: CvpA family protein [Methylococcaceae bacterium]|nr:CvpA family protein [Methylococcaceae bacterium]
MIWIDYGILGLIGISAVVGVLRGLIREVFSLTLWGVAAWLGLTFARDFSGRLEGMIPVPSLRMAAAFLLIFIGTLLLGGLVNYLLGKLVDSTGLSGTDRIAGLLFGMARGGLIVAVLVFLGGMTPLPQDPWWKQSALIPPFQSLAVWLRDHIPADLAGQVHFR